MADLIIKSDRIFLRPLNAADAKVLFAYRSKPQVSIFQLWKPAEIRDAAEFIDKAGFTSDLGNNQWNQFAVCLQTNQEMIGDVGVLLNDDKAEIGFTIAPDFQRKGFAFESVACLLSYLFKKTSIKMIIAYSDPKNMASINLLKKIGFILKFSDNHENAGDSDLCFYLNKPENSKFSTKTSG